MSQTTTGIRALLSSPRVYDFFQTLMGANSIRRALVKQDIRPEEGSIVLDIGCGTGQLCTFFDRSVNYYGFDLSAEYIDYAKKHFGFRGEFHNALVDNFALESLPKFDRVIAMGVLHHLDDTDASKLFELAKTCLKPGGHLVTLDPVYVEGQSAVARFLISRDRGNNVRQKNEYTKLAKQFFPSTINTVRHRSWIPYSHCILECQL